MHTKNTSFAKARFKCFKCFKLLDNCYIFLIFPPPGLFCLLREHPAVACFLETVWRASNPTTKGGEEQKKEERQTAPKNSSGRSSPGDSVDGSRGGSGGAAAVEAASGAGGAAAAAAGYTEYVKR